jgi:hypothetical protein
LSNNDELVQSNKKFFAKKVGKVRVEENVRTEFKKKKRLETYGITE